MALAVPAAGDCAGLAQSQQSPARRAASVDDLLTDWNGSEDLWVFAYGSLIWHPGFAGASGGWRRCAAITGPFACGRTIIAARRTIPAGVRPGSRRLLPWGGLPDRRQRRADGLRDALAPRDGDGRLLPALADLPYQGSARARAGVPAQPRLPEYAADVSDDRLLASVRNAVGHSGPCGLCDRNRARIARTASTICAWASWCDAWASPAETPVSGRQKDQRPNMNSTLPLPLPPGM